LAITGQTTIEFLTRRSARNSQPQRRNDEIERYDFRQSSKMRNLEYIFGTNNVLKMFLPSRRSLFHDGIQWESYLNHNNLTIFQE